MARGRHGFTECWPRRASPGTQYGVDLRIRPSGHVVMQLVAYVDGVRVSDSIGVT